MKIQELKSTLEESSGYSLAGSFTRDLIISKVWLLHELAQLTTDVSILYNLGSWYGNLALYINLLDIIKPKKIINVEQNQKWLAQSQRMSDYIGAKNVDHLLQDANDLDYQSIDADTVVVNTSVNDMQNKGWFDNIPQNTLVAMQTRNQNPTHCKYQSNQDLRLHFPLSKVLYQGQKSLRDPETKYTRFMVIGYK